MSRMYAHDISLHMAGMDESFQAMSAIAKEVTTKFNNAQRCSTPVRVFGSCL